MKPVLALLLLASCGGATVTPTLPTPTVDAAGAPDTSPPAIALDASTPVDASKVAAYKLTLVGEASLGTTTGIEGPAFSVDGSRVAIAIESKPHVFDATSLAPVVLKGGVIKKATSPLLAVGSLAFDPSTGEVLQITPPKGFTCETTGYSKDIARVSMYCGAAGKDGTLVIDTHTGVLVGNYREFQTAAPVRTGTITASGNFVFWQSRASGAFEEVSSHVTGPTISSHATMSPDERFLFAAPDRDWLTEAPAVGDLINAKTGKTVLTFTQDVDSGVFSPSSRLIAVVHAKTPHAQQWVSVHSVDHEAPLVKLPDQDVLNVAFSFDDTRIAITTASHKLRVYRIDPL